MEESMRKTLRIMVATALGAFLLAPALMAADAGIRTHQLPNGITVITQPKTWNPIVAVTLMVDAGSKYDPPGLRGLANVTTELLLRGTESMNALELAELADGSGIMLRTLTTEDFAEINLTALDRQLDTVLEILAGIVVRPTFEDEQIIEVQKKSLDALEMQKDDAFSRTYARLNELMYGEHPYAYPVVGTPRGIDSVRRADVWRFYQTRYRGGSTVISIVGNYSPGDAVEKLAELLADYPSGTAGKWDLPSSDGKGPAEADVFKASTLGQIQIGYSAPSVTGDDYAAASVLTGVLGDGTASRLYRALGPDGAGVAEVTGAFYPYRYEAGRIVTYAETSEVDRTLGIMQQVIAGLSDEPPTAEELTRAKNRLKGRIALKGETNLEQARRLAVGELWGLGADHVDTYLNEIDHVDADDVLRVARERLVDPVKVVQRPPTAKKTKRSRGI
jgi:zinc protease